MRPAGWAHLAQDKLPTQRITTVGLHTEFGGESGDLEFQVAHEFQYDGDTSLYEDEETEQFYGKLLDLRAIVPQILLKDQPPPVETEVKDTADKGELMQIQLS